MIRVNGPFPKTQGRPRTHMQQFLFTTMLSGLLDDNAGADTGGRGDGGVAPPPEGWVRRRGAARNAGQAPDTRQFVRLRPPFNVFLDPRLPGEPLDG